MPTSRERTDAYASQGGHVYRKFQMACIRSGSSCVLRNEMEEPEYQDLLIKLFAGDYANAILSLNFIWAQAWDAAVDAGVTETEADRIYQKYFQKASSMRSVDNLIHCHIQILPEFAEAVRRQQNGPAYSALIRKTCQYTEVHLSEPLQVQQIAEVLQTNPSYLSHRFRTETGMSLTSYIQMKKMDAAKMLLQTDYPVSLVMERLGFVSQSHFTKQFKEYTGMTPGQYKRKADRNTADRSSSPGHSSFVPMGENWYYKAEEFGHQQGLELQSYHIACVRRGKTAPLREYFQSPAYLEELREMFGENLQGAIETFIYLWPHAERAAAESGLDTKEAIGLRNSYMSRLYACNNVLEVLDLNKEFFLNLAEKVSEI